MDIIYTIWLRSITRYIRSKSRIIGSISMPLFFLLFLGFGLNSVVNIPGLGENYIQFLIPGMVAMSVLFTSVFSGIQIIWDKQFGFLKETLGCSGVQNGDHAWADLRRSNNCCYTGHLDHGPFALFGTESAKFSWFSYRTGIHDTDRNLIHCVRYCDSIENGGYDRVSAHHEFRYLPDLRSFRGIVPDQFPSWMARTDNHV